MSWQLFYALLAFNNILLLIRLWNGLVGSYKPVSHQFNNWDDAGASL